MTKHEWKQLYHRQIQLGVCYCALCGQQIKKIKEFSLDHNYPRSRQGQDVDSNWLPAHKLCNQQKGALTLEEYNQWKRLELIRNGRIKER